MKDIHARIPIDRISARAISAGVAYKPQKTIRNLDTDLPIKTREPTQTERRSNGFVDLSGQRVGRFTVIGMASQINAMWVVRCDCGRYATRTSKAIKNPNNSSDCCEHCRHLFFLKRDERFRRTGKNLTWIDI